MPVFFRSRLAVAAAAALVPVAAAAADTIVVTGTREPLPIAQLAADVVVIDAATIASSPADSVADLLRREAGLQMSRNGGPGQSSSVLIRGAGATQSLLLVDGVRVGSATLGQPELEAFTLAGIERIEVLRGPGSSVYGADASGGVINIITKRGEGAPRLDAAAAVGGHRSAQASVGGGAKIGAWDVAASLAHERSDGVSALRPGDAFGNYNPDRDGYRQDSAQARVGFSPLAGQRIGATVLRTRLKSQYDASEFLPPTYAQDASPDFRQRLDTQVSALDWRGEFGTLTGSAAVSRSVDDLESGGITIDRFRTVRDSVGAQLAWNAGWARIVGALEHAKTAAETAVLGTRERRTDAAVVALDGKLGAWSWQADARHDSNSDFGDVNTGRIGGAWSFAPGFKLRALAGTTFRAPSFNDLYYPGYGVATLKPERGRSIEAGLDWRAGASEAALTVYRNRMRDLIGYQADPTQCPNDPAYAFGCASNVARATLQGATLSARRHWGAFGLRAQLDFLKAHDDATGARLNRRAAHQESLGADWSEGAWSAGADVLRVGARPDGGKILSAETTLDLNAAWRFAKQWTLTAKLLNATDRDIEPARDYQGLGRQAWIGVRYSGGL